jgi:N-ethylmaleimide reductase
LFSPIQVGPLVLKHRIVMAPLTRLRATVPGDVPVDLMAEYHGQRASQGGLIISEGATVSIVGRGYLRSRYIFVRSGIGLAEGTDAVHAKAGYIFLQLWHVGRVSHIEMTNGQAPVSPHRRLEIPEIPALIDDFRKAAEYASLAGFDGVELHGANGHLFDQFLQDGTNKRTDACGGPVENRARLLFEVLDAIAEVWGWDRVGLRLSPNTEFNSMFDSNPLACRCSDLRFAQADCRRAWHRETLH